MRSKLALGGLLLLLGLSTLAGMASAGSGRGNGFGSGYISSPSSLLEGQTPEAAWIWDTVEDPIPNHYLYIRKTFTLDGPASQATAYISATSFAQLYINGRFVERVPVNSDPAFQVYDCFDLTSYFVQGNNVIAALVYNYGVGMHHRIHARGGFFFQGEIACADGTVTAINSDTSWRVRTADAWAQNTGQRHVHHLIGFREEYDAATAPAGWNLSTFDDSAWEPAVEIGTPPIDPWRQIVVAKRPFLERSIVEPVDSWESDGYRVFDFGKIITGSPRFTIDALEDGVRFDIGTAERLDSDKVPMMTHVLDYTDTYIAKQGRQSWQPITWRGFRYFAVKTHPQVRVTDAAAEFRSYPVKNKGAFSCSDSGLNRDWEIGRWTVQLCSQDTLMDTPWREQTHYIAGDSRYIMRYANYAFGPEAAFLFEYNILSGAFSQRWKDDGSIRSRYPTDWLLGPETSTYIPDYQLEWIMMVHEYYLYYGDDDLVKQVYPNLKRLLDYFETYIHKEHHLLGRVPGWIVLDHPDTYPMDVDGENTAMNCLYYGALNSASRLARDVVKDTEQADEWAQRAASIKRAVNNLLFSEDDGIYKDGFESSRFTQQTQVYALKYELVPDAGKSKLVDFIKSKGRSCERSFSYWLLNTMFDEGQGQWALDYIRTYWGNEANSKDFNGAWSECWRTDWGTSSHAWSSGPTALLPEKVLGVEPLLPGWKVFKIQPHLYDLKWAEGVISTVAGDIAVKVQRIEKEKSNTIVQIHAVIPGNTLAKVYVPIDQSKNSTIYVDGKILWQNGVFPDTHDKILNGLKMNNYVVFDFQQGSYEIRSVTEG